MKSKEHLISENPRRITRLLIFWMLISFHIDSPAQPPHLWIRATGTDCQARATGIAVDNNGNVFEAGYFRSTISNFDTTLYESPFFTGLLYRNDTYLFKYDSLGNFIWALKAENSYEDSPNGIVTDAAGNVYVSGLYYGDTLTFGGLTTTHTGHLNIKAYLLKVSPAGTPVWLRTFYAPSDPNGFLSWGMWLNDMTINSNQELIVTGTIRTDSSHIDGFIVKNHGVNGSHTDFFVAKFNTTTGTAIWVKQAISVNGYENVEQITVDGQNAIYVCGHTISNTLTMDNFTLQAASISPSNEAFIFKLSDSGAVLWADRFGAPNSQKLTQAQGITVDHSGNIYVAGEFSSTELQFGSFLLQNNNTQLLSNGSRDLFVAKYNAQGVKQWVKGITHNLNYDYSESIFRLQTGADNNIYAVGMFRGQSITWDSITVFNSIPTATASSAYNRIDPFIVKFDADGIPFWIKTLHNSTYNHNLHDETLTRFVLDNGNNFYGAGFLLTTTLGLLVDTTIYFHPLPGPDNCSNSRDAFIIKIQGTMNWSGPDSCGITVCDDGNVCTMDSCMNGICVFTPIICDDGDSCTTDSCDPLIGCVYTPITGCGVSVKATTWFYENISVYPNPFSSHAVLNLTTPIRNGSLHITDLTGKSRMMLRNIAGDVIRIERKNLPDGIYVFHLMENQSHIGLGKLVIIDQ
ncbi:MAG: hypothetical protein KatS3mg031_1324 [Chitinophagales bacterium]|nr:MAG: hypothetical protein KatS3mg031_1324 [Chitinophagales bacterium]